MSELSAPLKINKNSSLNNKKNRFNIYGQIERKTSEVLKKNVGMFQNRKFSSISLNDSISNYQ